MTNLFYTDFDITCESEVRRSDYRTPFEMDRDRLVHTSAFRRLQAKTQVFFSGEYDFYRSRLTHSIEVAQIGRSIATMLNRTSPLLSSEFQIDPALVEVACLAHDLGHPPFGHAGERTLNDLMLPYGGFEGNAQTLRILTETIYSSDEGRKGLSPTRAFADAVLKYKQTHSEYQDAPANHFIYDEQQKIRSWVFFGAQCNFPAGEWNTYKSIECQIMDWADDTAYSVNDIIDGVHAGFITRSGIEEWAGAQSLGNEEETLILDLLRQIGRENIHRYFSSKIGKFIQAVTLVPDSNPFSTLTNRYKFKITIDPAIETESQLYKRLAVSLVFKTSKLQQFEFKGDMMLRKLFDVYVGASEGKGYKVLPSGLQKPVMKHTDPRMKARLICDYLAGMTDRFAIRTYRRLFDPDYGSMMDLV